MKAQDMTNDFLLSMRRAYAGAQLAVDRFWSGVWRLELLRWLQERRMARTLEESGEYSMNARMVTERFRWLDRSARYWRESPPQVLATLEASERAGVPVSDLRLLAINRDIRLVGDVVQVRCCWWMPVLAYCWYAAVLWQWTLMSGLVALSPAPWLAKVVGVGINTLIFWALWPGFGLYTTRAYAAVKRSGAAVEQIALSLSADSASVTSISAHH